MRPNSPVDQFDTEKEPTIDEPPPTSIDTANNETELDPLSFLSALGPVVPVALGFVAGVLAHRFGVGQPQCKLF